MASLDEIVSYTNRFLRIRDVGDWDNALNGLQIENSGRVTRIGAAVDVSTRLLTEAAKQDVDLLIVHHGLFWPGLQPVQARRERRVLPHGRRQPRTDSGERGDRVRDADARPRAEDRPKLHRH